MKGFVSSRLHPLLTLLLLVGLVFAGWCVGLLLTFAVCQFAYGINMLEVQRIMTQPATSPYGWAIIMLVQGATAYLGFVGGGLLLPTLQGASLSSYFFPRRRIPVGWLLGAMVLVLASLPLMTAIMEWNTNLHLPSFLTEWETEARATEARLQELTRFLTRFTTTGRFIIALVVIAAGAAIGEELIFRGVVQRQLTRLSGSPEAAIWLTALLFSAIHFQVLGFFPRFILGLVFGYLYLWSGNILVPMAAHFTQNAFQLVLLYNQQRQWTSTDFDPDSTESMAWYWVVASLVLCASLLWSLRRRMLAYPIAEEPTEMHTLSSGGVATATAHAASGGRTLNHHGVDATKL
ncbi:CPBP family intramembrane glutamic endopeptidase [Hymenobacter sp. AT01-02]|uniref:CPBP family intramembrane glutamic endopeptidase n=1 Tax=Hymenobacter sp. AT01-02 TaxID=1571877 RepID=UPI0006E31A59|nr:CPBP family intramembrane glutamic endopeptidase [Hymenobacter sp. AT01-02]